MARPETLVRSLLSTVTPAQAGPLTIAEGAAVGSVHVETDAGHHTVFATATGRGSVALMFDVDPETAERLALAYAAIRGGTDQRSVLDGLHRSVNALGGSFSPADERAAGYDEALGFALEAIEKAGGRDPITRVDVFEATRRLAAVPAEHGRAA